jgi:biuret amidohydrolase
VSKVDSSPQKFPRLGDFQPSRTALIVIDMQGDFLLPGGMMDRIGADLDFLRTSIPAVQNVLAAARNSPMRVVHTREGYASDLSDLPTWRRMSQSDDGIKVGDSGPLGRALIRGEIGWRIVEELSPLDDEPIFDKSSYGAFVTTTIESQLRDWSVNCLILAGVTTDCCVTTTLREALDRGFDCLVVEDGVASRNVRAHDAALDLIRHPAGLFGQLTPHRAILDAIRYHNNGTRK